MTTGYAYSPDSEKIMTERVKRFRFLRALRSVDINVKREYPGYTLYKGWCSSKMTEDDVCIYCDSGHVPFGGRATITDNSFVCKIYND